MSTPSARHGPQPPAVCSQGIRPFRSLLAKVSVRGSELCSGPLGWSRHVCFNQKMAGAACFVQASASGRTSTVCFVRVLDRHRCFVRVPAPTVSYGRTRLPHNQTTTAPAVSYGRPWSGVVFRTAPGGGGVGSRVSIARPLVILSNFRDSLGRVWSAQAPGGGGGWLLQTQHP